MKTLGFFRTTAVILAFSGLFILSPSCDDDSNDTSETTNTTDTTETDDECSAYTQSSGSNEASEQEYCSSNSDENAVQVSGGTFSMTDCILNKAGGDTDDSDGSSFYGINAAILADEDGTVIMNGGSITTDAIGANGIVAYGGAVEVSDVTIECSQNLSRGIHATGGGSITASDLTITTSGSNSSVIALDRGGGTVDVTGGSYTTTGQDCAVLYSTGNLTVSDITGSSSQGEIGVIEGDNYIIINNSTITSGADSDSRGLMILQSGSGDAGTGTNGIITVNGGSLVMTGENTTLIEIVTNVEGEVNLNSVETTIPSGILMTVDYNTRWSTNGATGILNLSGEGTTYTGSIVIDSYSSAELTINNEVIWQGDFDNSNTASSSMIVIDGGSWDLTGDSFVDSITLTNEATINKNGYNLTYQTLTNTSGTIND